MNNFLEQLKSFYLERNDFLKREFNRVLPFGELVVDRWDKAKYLDFGDGTSVYDSSLIMGDVSIGKNVWVGPHTLLDGLRASLKIGDFCHVSSGVQIYTHDSVAKALTEGKADFRCGAVNIEKCVYIGPYAVVTKGVTIGHHSIIGAYSLVNKSVPDFSVVWGQPAKIVGRVVLNSDSTDFSIDYFNE